MLQHQGCSREREHRYRAVVPDNPPEYNLHCLVHPLTGVLWMIVKSCAYNKEDDLYQHTMAVVIHMAFTNLFLREICRIFIKSSLSFSPKGPINNKLVPEPIMVKFRDANMHHSVAMGRSIWMLLNYWETLHTFLFCNAATRLASHPPPRLLISRQHMTDRKIKGEGNDF